MNRSAIVLGVFSLAMAFSLVVLYLLIEHVLTQHPYVVYVKPGAGEIPPADISALHEEVRRIQKEAGDA